MCAKDKSQQVVRLLPLACLVAAAVELDAPDCWATI